MSTAYLGELAALASGVTAYLLYFQHGERQLHPIGILQFHLLMAGVLFVARQQYLSEPPTIAVASTARFSLLYLAALYTSTITYRLFLNPLNSAVPGGAPLARLTKFAHTWQNRSFKGHQELLRLHRQHGDYVRLGPNDISVTDAAAVQVISAPTSKCVKADWYANDTPLTSLHTTRDRAAHDRRRRVWAPAFSDRALKGYEARIQKYTDLLLDGLASGRFAEAGGQAVNVSDVFNWYSFDVMGDLAFGKSFDCLDSATTHWAIKLLNEGMKPAGLGLPSWLFRIALNIPGAAADYWNFIAFCSSQLAKRMGEQAERNSKLAAPDSTEEKDITHQLIAHYETMDRAAQRKALPMLQGDSRLIIVAGSDTTAATLVHMFYWFAKMPAVADAVRQEIAACRDDGGAFVDRKLAEAEMLNGAVYEALRLNPPVPSGIFRKTPKEGVYIGDKFIPGNTTIQMPWYVMGHDEKNYTDASSFRPERWSAGSKLVHHKDAFQSFSSGPFGCIGKNLGLMEVRTVAAQLLARFDVAFAPGEDGAGLLRESIDHFTMGLAPLRLLFVERQGQR